MKYYAQIITPIEFLTTDKPIKLEGKSPLFYILGGQQVISKLSDDLKDQIGNFNVKTISNGNCLFSEIPLEGTPFEDLNAPKMALTYGSYFYKFSFGLWLLKDNNITTNFCFCDIREVGSNKSISQGYCIIGSLIHNSQGEFETTDFNSIELSDYYNNLYPKIRLLENLPEDEEKKSAIKPEGKGYRSAQRNQISYNHSRLERALLMLIKLRQDEFIISKITSYISILECLFTSSGKEINKTIQHRTSSLLGGSNDEIKKNRTLISKAYNIRSRYVHGDSIIKEIQDILKISKDLDILTRAIINKIVKLENNDVFTKKDSLEMKNQFEDFFLKKTPLS